MARDTLFAAALRLLAEEGPAALRVRDVAAAAEISTMGVYTHFGSKQGLVQEIYSYGFAELSARLAAAATTGDPREDVQAIAGAYRTFGIENEALYGVMFERAVEDFVPSQESRLASLAAYELLVGRITAWRGCAAPEAERVAFLIFGAVHGLVSLELTHRRWGGAVMEHVRDDGSKSTFVDAIDSLLNALETG